MNDSNWLALNQKYLSAQLARVRAWLQARVSETSQNAPPETDMEEIARTVEMANARLPARPALDALCGAFQLSAFERDVLLLCAGVELDAEFAALVARTQNDSRNIAPTFSLALALLPDAHWSALTPERPLRYWRLLEIGAHNSLTRAPLRIDERVLNELVGAPHLDERLVSLVEPAPPAHDLVASQRALVERIVRAWSDQAMPVIQLGGADAAGKRAVAAHACAELELRLMTLNAFVLPTDARDLDGFIRLWEREAVLSGSALLLACDDLDAADAARSFAVTRVVETLRGALFVASRERLRNVTRPLMALDVHKPTAREQRALWTQALDAYAKDSNGAVDALAAQFDLSAPTIRAAASQAVATANGGLAHALWDAARTQARPRLDGLAQRIEPVATFEDIVLPAAQIETLRDIARHVRQRHVVYDAWGFRAKSSRGLGISALFTGASGTGKTMAAEVLANDLRLDLQRIDLSQVVSKYIGETEKNLRRVFDAAEEGGAILLFDEADALFGKRSEVKDSHDRYANIEISYLLQRMEQYRGLAILTTNLKEALDAAFLRRIRFVAHFPFPDAAARAEIWRRVFPAQTPTEALDYARLARLNIAGGNIRNIALNAAFLAADAGEPVRMSHLWRAAQSEYAKLNKPMTDTEVRDWRVGVSG
jgi:hypothetical protein